MCPSRIQTKEKLINSLQSGVGGAMGVADAAKLEEMRLEKEYSQTQLHTAFQHIESLKADIQVWWGNGTVYIELESAYFTCIRKYMLWIEW